MQEREDILTVLTRWPGDPLPALPSLAGFSLRRSHDDAEMALLQGSFEGVIAARRGAGNVPCVARLRGEPIGFAWTAGRSGHIGSLGLTFALGPRDCYVWDLTALEAGRAIAACSHILRGLVTRHADKRFWLALPCERVHEAESAGLTAVAQVYRQEGEARIEAIGASGRVADAAHLLALDAPLTATQRSTAAA
ncbi:MAG TPA: hypothetical protein VH951_09770 [Dehalococcoidia bacterium]